MNKKIAKTAIAIIIALIVALFATDVIAEGVGKHIDVNGVECPTTESGRYQTDSWGQCEMNPKEFNFRLADTWQDEIDVVLMVIAGFILFPVLCIILINILPVVLSSPFKILAVGVAGYGFYIDHLGITTFIKTTVTGIF